MAENSKNQAFEEVSSRVNSDELEREVLSYWDEHAIFETSLTQREGSDLFTFYDGPPYATGKPHYGHILQSAIKDAVLRYKTMQGYYVPRRVGWDCHGLPIENIVEKEVGYETKKAIEDDIESFNAQCRDTVYRYVDEFTSTLKRIGRWADYENAYSTMDRDYMESEWWVFKRLWEQGLVYKDFKSTAYCTRCATPLSNFEVSMGYKDVHDTAVYVKLYVDSDGSTLPSGLDGTDTKLALLVWTTTPWTLPGNVAVAISSSVTYVSVEHEGEEIIVAKERMNDLFGEGAEIVREWSEAQLRNLKYTPLYATASLVNEGEDRKKMYGIVTGGHVTADEGTGLVHMAPAFGAEDAEVGTESGLPVLKTVDTVGRFVEEVPSWGGQHIFDANEDIVRDLKERGLLYKREHYKHSYPHCWRCDTPLIYYALDSWFVRVSQLKEQMLDANEQIHWIPEHVKHGRFEKGIESAPDWAISRNRFWSTPMPIWECDVCEQRTCVGSVAELQRVSGASPESVSDLHRPYVDDVTWACGACEGTMKRIPEVLDVWFDSGSMPYSQWHYPFERKEFVEDGYPADFIAESIEMTRAWFYVLHVLAAALTREETSDLGHRRPAFLNAIASGLIFAEDGNKLSKKLKNYPELEPTLERYGADMLRFYLLSSASLGEPYRFSEKDLKTLQRNVYLTLWNVYSFFVRYANVHGWTVGSMDSFSEEVWCSSSDSILDRWIDARMRKLEADVIEASDEYKIDTAARLFVPFIDDLSNWYVRRSRHRFQKPSDDRERDAAFGTLYHVLVRTSRLLAPFMPFVAEQMFRNLTDRESVHLEQLPSLTEVRASVRSDDASLIAMMATVRDVVSEGLALRAKQGIKVRQPLARLVAEESVDERIPEDLYGVIAEEVNVKSFEVSSIPNDARYVVSDEDARVRVGLDTNITDELAGEGMARDIIRHGQVLRRNAGYALDDRITVVFTTEDAGIQKAFAANKEMIVDALQADEVVSDGEADASDTVKVGGGTAFLGVKST